MPQIKLVHTQIDAVPKKYCRIILTEASPSSHRFVEHADGTLSYTLGVGKWKHVTPRTLRTLLRSIVQAAQSHEIEHVVLNLSQDTFPKLNSYSPAWFYSTIVENVGLASYSFTKYKSKPDKKKALKEVLIVSENDPAIRNGFTRGLTVSEYVNSARDIANTPGGDMSPSQLGEAAKQLVKGTKATVTVLGETQLKKLKMGALLAVGQGTKSETKLIIMEYWGKGKPPTKTKPQKSTRPIVLIGKGITYDTGGLNVKPSGSMHDMHLDMSGGSSVLASVACIAKLGLKQNVVAIVPAAENAISDDAMRAGDIVTSMSGKTIEVLHTDAEGRMVLADALTYSERYSPSTIIDVATLTGAALIALGQHASALMTKDENLRHTLERLGEESGDLLWPLPLWEEYKQHIKSSRADISNIAANFSRWGGSIEGGTFLSHFVPKNVPWAHIDIAPRMDSIPSDKLAKGSTGEPVRLLVSFVETL